MKKLILMMLSVVFIYSSSYADGTPAEVQKAFMQQFPTASNVTWEQVEKANWEARFLNDGRQFKAQYDAKGVWIETQETISAADLPKEADSLIQEKYPCWVYTMVEKSESVRWGHAYRAQIENGKEGRVIVYREHQIYENKKLDKPSLVNVCPPKQH